MWYVRGCPKGDMTQWEGRGGDVCAAAPEARLGQWRWRGGEQASYARGCPEGAVGAVVGPGDGRQGWTCVLRLVRGGLGCGDVRPLLLWG
jgi:hypothetical protein